MEDIVHYRSCIEDFSIIVDVEEEVTVDIDDIDPFSIEQTQTVSEPFIITEKVIKSISEEEFKQCLRENKDVNVQRTTIVVSEDPTKNNISLKLYYFSKYRVTKGKLKNKVFKIRDKQMFSISVNKSTGDFTVYSRVKMGRKYDIVIRKSILSYKVEPIINNILSHLDIGNEMDVSLSCFYNLLGYCDINTEMKLINNTFNVDYGFDDKPSLKSFLMINYLKKSQIKMPNYFLLEPFFKLFIKNKKQYHGKTIEDFFINEYNIKNHKIIDVILYKLIDLNYNAYISKDVNQKKYLINPLILKVLDNNNQLPEITKDFFIENNLDYSYVVKTLTQKYIFNIIELYEFDYEFIMDKLQFKTEQFIFLDTITQLNSLYCAGIKIKNIDHLKIVSELVLKAIEHSGTAILSRKSYNRLKRYLKPGETLSLVTNKQYRDFDFGLKITDKNEILCVKFNRYYTSSYQYRNKDDIFRSIINTKYNHSIIKALELNTNKLRDSIDVKYIYSKPFFESIATPFFDNIKSHIDYIEKND
jgi:hypothetical protein